MSSRTAEQRATAGTLPCTADDSFYLYDRATFLRNAAEFDRSFRACYGSVQLALSLKTNYLPLLLRDAVRAGLFLEVVSAMEYDMARALGVEPAKIVVNGPTKGADLIIRALREGALVQLDSPKEIDAVMRAAGGAPAASLRVGLRINVPPAPGAFSRFGFDADAPDFETHMRRLRVCPAVKLTSLHAHICSPQRRADDYRALTMRLIAVADRIFGSTTPEIINVGGGFLSPAPEETRKQFNFTWTDFAEYGEAVGSAMAERYGRDGSPCLMLEPGLAIEATAMRFFTRVLDIRTIGAQQVISVAGTCYDVKPTKHGKNLPLQRVATGNEPVIECSGAIVAGNTCMEDDILHRGFHGPLAVGDFLEFGQAGAYTFVLRPMFISARPPVYLNDPREAAWHRIEDEEDWRAKFKFANAAPTTWHAASRCAEPALDARRGLQPAA